MIKIKTNEKASLNFAVIMAEEKLLASNLKNVRYIKASITEKEVRTKTWTKIERTGYVQTEAN